MAYKKFFGLLFIVIGCFIIFWTLLESYNIFTNKKLPPEIFKISEETGIQKENQPETPQQKIEVLQKQLIKEELEKNLPKDSLVKLLNLISWSIGAFVLFSGGGRIAQLGLDFLK